MNNLTASLEDYLEIIYNSIETNNSIKAVEIAKRLNISRASVSEALTRLSDKGLIVYEGHKGITITEEGRKKAKKVIVKHNTLSAFFENTLGITKEIAEESACKMEHVISEDVFKRIAQFQKYCEENNTFVENFKKGY